MFPDERSKSAEVTEPGRAAEAFFMFEIKRMIICLNKTKKPFTALVSQRQFAKKLKKISKI